MEFGWNLNILQLIIVKAVLCIYAIQSMLHSPTTTTTTIRGGLSIVIVIITRLRLTFG
jgi:hypothetical protein